jgi:hypothetical protein
LWIFHGYLRHDGVYKWLPLELLLVWILGIVAELAWVSERYTISDEGIEHSGLWGGTRLSWSKVLFWECIPKETGKERIVIFGEGKRLVVRGDFADYPKLKQALEAYLHLVDRSHSQVKEGWNKVQQSNRASSSGFIKGLGNLRVWIIRLFLYQYWIGLGLLGVYALLAKRNPHLASFAPMIGLLVLNLYIVLWMIWSFGERLLNHYLDFELQRVYLERDGLPLVLEISQEGGYGDRVTIVEAFWVLGECLRNERVKLSEAQRETIYDWLWEVSFSEPLLERILDWVVEEQDRHALPYLEELRKERELNQRIRQKLDACYQLLAKDIA